MRIPLGAILAGLLVTPCLAGAQSQTSAPATQGSLSTTQSPTNTTSPTWEFGIGYQFLRTGEFCAAFDESACSEENPGTFPVGLLLDGVRNWGALGLVAEGGWSRDEDDADNPFGDRLSTDMLHAAIGLRLTGNWGRVRPYGQILGGGVVTRFDGIVTGLPFRDTRGRKMAQAGVGATFVTGDGWGVFADVAYRRMFLDDDEDFVSGRNDVRGAVGIRLILD